MEGVIGKFVVDCKIKKPNPQALDDEIAERLWKVSAELVGLEYPTRISTTTTNLDKHQEL